MAMRSFDFIDSGHNFQYKSIMITQSNLLCFPVRQDVVAQAAEAARRFGDEVRPQQGLAGP